MSEKSTPKKSTPKKSRSFSVFNSAKSTQVIRTPNVNSDASTKLVFRNTPNTIRKTKKRRFSSLEPIIYKNEE